MKAGELMKDPAFLFYSSDFISGTYFLTDEQVGRYIRVLCMQHQKGHLKEKDMLNICKTYDEDIFIKFKKDSEGNFYNERLDVEISKRIKYSESRRNNRKSKKKSGKKEEDMSNICETYDNTYDEHMGNENENINKDININRDNRGMGKEESWNGIEPKKQNSFCKPTIKDINDYCLKRNNNVDSQQFYDFYESKGWFIGKNKMKDWKACVRTWEKNKEKDKNTATARDYFDYAEELRRQGL